MGFGDGAAGCAVGEGVVAQPGVVGAPDALAGDAVAAVLVFEGGAGCWADGGALVERQRHSGGTFGECR